MKGISEVLPLAAILNTGVIGMIATGHGTLDVSLVPTAIRFALAQTVAVILTSMNTLAQLEEN